jgi:hypothetical protein
MSTTHKPLVPCNEKHITQEEYEQQSREITASELRKLKNMISDGDVSIKNTCYMQADMQLRDIVDTTCDICFLLLLICVFMCELFSGYHQNRTAKEYIKLETETSHLLQFMMHYRNYFTVVGAMFVALFGMYVTRLSYYQLPWYKTILGTVVSEVVWDAFKFTVMFTITMGVLGLFGPDPFIEVLGKPVCVALYDSVKCLSLWISGNTGVNALFISIFYYYTVASQLFALLLEYVEPRRKFKYVVLFVSVGVYAYAQKYSSSDFGNSTMFLINSLYFVNLLQRLVDHIIKYRKALSLQSKMATTVDDNEIIGTASRGELDNY